MKLAAAMGLVAVGGSTAWAGVEAEGQGMSGLAVVRWVNDAGGAWNEPTNWDAERVPLDGEAVLFDLDAAYTVTVCGARPAMWAWLRVDRSEVVFDLCGSALAFQPKGLYKWLPVIEVVGDSEFEAGVVFTNGVVFDPESWLVDAELVIDGSDGEEGARGAGRGAVVTIASDAASGPVGRVTVTGDAELRVEGGLELFFSGMLGIGEDAAVIVEGVLEGWTFAAIVVDGAMEVLGTAEAVESTIAGDGLVRVADGGVLDGWYLFNGVGVRPEGASAVTSAYITDATVDWRGATGDTVFTVPGDLVYAVFERVEFEADLCSAGGSFGAPLVEFGNAFEVGFWDSRFRLGGSCVPAVGEAAALMRWRWPLTFGDPVPKSVELELVSDAEGEHPVVLRVGRVDGQTFAVFALGVPEDWCPADLDFNGVADFFDASLFLAAYQTGSVWADVNGDRVVDFFDVSAFFAMLGGGCGE